jgi:hypothetical protein
MTTPTQFRLSAETLADLDQIQRHLSKDGREASRTDAVRVAARNFAQKIGGKKKSRKNEKKPS